MKTAKMIAATASVLLWSLSTQAQAPKTVKLVVQGDDLASVWNDRDAMGDFIRMHEAGVRDPMILGSSIICKVESGTQVVALERGARATRVIVVEGPHAGCRGYVQTSQVPL